MAEDKYNLKNPAVKRILQELKEMQSNPSDDFMSLPLEENIFEWQFAIRGPRDSEFEGGIYHGRIQLPAEYPFKPPSFMLLTPNGRFETQTKICLSISNHHPEHWQPSWSVRTALVALIAFMPTNPNGALGSLDYKKEERHALAIKSREAAPRFGTPERQKLIDEIHEYMLSKAPLVPQLNPSQASEEHSNDKEDEANQSSEDAAGAVTPGEGLTNPAVGDRIVEEPHEASLNGNPRPEGMGVSRQLRAGPTSEQLLQRSGPRVQKPADDRLFTWAAVGLTIAIVVLLLKKFMKASGHGAVFMDGS
ncbi:Ubiquitin-conjugating enzyme E2 32 [Camellia lanceoleosa]|uniref:Ubiquitin-conjugating enzyme E2 32 n=1 Tax=Camellia lanceoleosa TaxID=1840588 RepID=A0ACC0HFE6_9ERIC|nr:Ubiquitin-conjugating enzyme E2 32 [Camellia lanceoleosa]